MGLTDILQSGGIKVHIAKKKMKQTDKPKRNRLESVVEYLAGQIDDLQKQGNLDPSYHPITEGKRKGDKIRAINAWSAVDDEGKREILIMCKNKKMFINEAAAKDDRGIFIDKGDDSYGSVLAYLKHLHKEFSKLTLDEFEPWTRIKKNGEVKKIN